MMVVDTNVITPAHDRERANVMRQPQSGPDPAAWVDATAVESMGLRGRAGYN